MQKTLFFSPGRTVLASIFLTVLLGTIVLMLPICQKEPVSFIDCLFTAASSTCVTGLLTVPFDSFTHLGKIVILLLIQIGGIGLVTLTLFFASLFLNLGLATKLMMGQILELNKWRNIKRILVFIIIFTIVIELIGALCIYGAIADLYPHNEAVFHAIFHSISSFCSAGLSSFGNSLVAFKSNILMLVTTGILILCGTIGFIPLFEIGHWIIHRIQDKRYYLSLTTRVIIWITSILVIGAACLFSLLEYSTHWHNYTAFERITNIFFNALAYRSTGLTTIDLSTMQSATTFLIIMYSFIGSSPGSTGSGIKVTTFALFLATIKSVATGKSTINLKGRRIPQDQIFKALSILSLGFSWIVGSTFLLLLFEKQATFGEVFFETVSSFTTLGLGSGLTPSLSIWGKSIIIANMFFGRLGTLTLLLAIKSRPEREEFKYPEERLMMS